MKPRATMIWVDLETTGLSAKDCKVLEIAAIATTDDLVELGRFHAVTNLAAQVTAAQVAPEALAMHLASGLWVDSISARGKEHEIQNVDRALADFIELHANADMNETERRKLTMDERKKRAPQLAGSSVHFDRAFLDWHLPQAAALLHYRNADVTTLHEVARRWWPEIHNRGSDKSAHRAMADIERSLARTREYRDAIGKWRSAASATPQSIEQVLDAAGAVTLNRYQRDNLVAHLALVMDGTYPGNSGDWTGEVMWKLAEHGYDPAVHKPNVTPDRARQQHQWVQNIAAKGYVDAPEAEHLAGLRALVGIPSTSLSKSLRTPEVSDALEWIRGVLAEVDQRAAEKPGDANEAAP